MLRTNKPIVFPRRKKTIRFGHQRQSFVIRRARCVRYFWFSSQQLINAVTRCEKVWSPFSGVLIRQRNFMSCVWRIWRFSSNYERPGFLSWLRKKYHFSEARLQLGPEACTKFLQMCLDVWPLVRDDSEHDTVIFATLCTGETPYFPVNVVQASLFSLCRENPRVCQVLHSSSLMQDILVAWALERSLCPAWIFLTSLTGTIAGIRHRIPAPIRNELVNVLSRLPLLAETLDGLLNQKTFNKHETCSICLSNDAGAIVELPCHRTHAFHVNCILGHFELRSCCPMCRSLV